MASIIEIKIPKALASILQIPINDNRRQQLRVLKKLLKKARFTSFGQQYHFDQALLSKHPGKKFQELVPFMITTKFIMNGGSKPWMEHPMLPGPVRSSITH